MIKRIKTLKQVGRFTELHSASGADHDFAELNVVFASNAAGKSTLCDVLRFMTLEEPAYIVGRKRLEAGVDWFGTMIGKIRAATGDDPLVRCQALMNDLTDVNNYSQRFHHRTTGAAADIPDARELVTYAKQTLSIIHK